MKCTDCKYCILQDEGYSNYTVEGTEVDCLLSMNKDFPVDRWYEKEPYLDFASECSRYTEGESVYFDVDGETTAEDYKDDDEIYRLLLQRQEG